MRDDSSVSQGPGEAAEYIVPRPWSTSLRSWATGLAAVLLMLVVIVTAWCVGSPWPMLLTAVLVSGAVLFAAWRVASGRAGDDSWLRKLY